LPGDWPLTATFSPDGETLASGVAETARVVDPAISTYRPEWMRLALVDFATGRVRLAEEHFGNFVWGPVWSRDGSWLIFNAPFDKSLFACRVHEDPPNLVPVVRRRGRPGPLVDVTDVLNASQP
jgi:hypothetical protein